MAGGGRSEDEVEVPWPAFVDLLTSVLITFMFFILIVTVALATMTLKTAENTVKGDSDKQVKGGAPSETPPLTPEPLLSPPPAVQPAEMREMAALQEKNQQMAQEISDLRQNLANLRAPLNKATEIKVQDESPSRLKVSFRRNEIGMLPDAAKQIEGFVTAWQRTHEGTPRLVLSAVEPDGLTQTQAREQALGRALNVRNVLIEAKIPPRSIAVRSVPGTPADSNADWVDLEIKAER